ncbi:DNA-binding wrky domain-containing protein [Phlyctema vagabunda]|uniref:DNA-binding wrky domain-containing protein n=1 Tax=Phlyctema vagabunda TaxID=108571 RepID=A0ABR4PLS9_9HELO
MHINKDFIASYAGGFLFIPVLLLGSSSDLLFFAAFFGSRNWDVLAAYAQQNIDPVLVADIIKCSLSALTIIQIVRFFRGLQNESSPPPDGLPKPMLFPSRTTHTRLFPKKHTFSYSYLLAGAPIGWKGSMGGMLSVDLPKKRTPWYWRLLSIAPDPNSTWYSVDADDYLEHGHVKLGLDGKLRRYLESQGANLDDYPYVYLVTAAKFMGYVSNPVSFWHLYSADKQLKAFVIEVNNTFNERHMYYSKANQGTSTTSKVPGDSDFDWGNVEKAASAFDNSIKQDPKATARFTKHWSKNFYVSPFNSRKGSYSQISYDPLYPSMTGTGPVNTTLTLNSSKAHAKLVARVFSDGPAIDPSSMTLWEKLRFLAAWWWVGLATFPRTTYQALTLLTRRKMNFLLRPEPLKDTIGRSADATEKSLELFFRDYLRDLVESADIPVIVKYAPSGLVESSEEIMISPSAQMTSAKVEVLEFKVLTPAFYSRFVRYADDLDAFHHEFHESQTIWLSDSLIVLDFLSSNKTTISEQRFSGAWDQICFKLIQNLRSRPAPIVGPSIAKDAKRPEVLPLPKHKATPDGMLTGMDKHVLTNIRSPERKSYRTKLLNLVISDHIAMGSLDIMGLEIFALKALALWAVAWMCKIDV